MITVSVSMVTYNHENYIAKAIASVVNQKGDFKIQLVIGEDQSTDNTREICEQFAAQYPEKIILLPSDKKYGIFPNFFRCIKCCTGNYYALLDGDDYWTDEFKLQKQLNFLESHPDFVGCFHRAEFVDNEGKNIGFSNSENIDYVSNRDLAFEAQICSSSNLLRNKLKDISFPSWYNGDWILNVIITHPDGKIKFMPETMSAYRIHAGGIWSMQTKSAKTLISMAETRKKVYLAYYDINDSALRKRLAIDQSRASIQCFKEKKWKEWLKYKIQSAYYFPEKIAHIKELIADFVIPEFYKRA